MIKAWRDQKAAKETAQCEVAHCVPISRKHKAGVELDDPCKTMREAVAPIQDLLGGGQNVPSPLLFALRKADKAAGAALGRADS